ncbi:hypothetical protein DFH07DRAFT_772856 [Mycena maculata]|uniref:Uncharacterized protein n=1 Tax=Mycena maculata TaxID=230809 RepID=A0AAD7J9C0_9AGAR|nr:hypothetical protein DFH07DRAFT_772856 [Mycena maculata]
MRAGADHPLSGHSYELAPTVTAFRETPDKLFGADFIPGLRCRRVMRKGRWNAYRGDTCPREMRCPRPRLGISACAWLGANTHRQATIYGKNETVHTHNGQFQMTNPSHGRNEQEEEEKCKTARARPFQGEGDMRNRSTYTECRIFHARADSEGVHATAGRCVGTTRNQNKAGTVVGDKRGRARASHFSVLHCRRREFRERLGQMLGQSVTSEGDDPVVPSAEVEQRPKATQ